MKLAKLFLCGLLISLIGSLPLGTLNVATFKISISSGRMPAFWFAFGCVIIEVIYVRVSLTAMDWVCKNSKVLRLLKFAIVFITLALATASFFAAFQNSATHTQQFQLKSSLSAFLLGIAMSAINPAQIPFWFGFSAVLQSKKILLPSPVHHAIYITAIAIGSMMASIIFIYAGEIMIKSIGDNSFTINIIVGCCFTIAAITQLVSIFWKRNKPSLRGTEFQRSFVPRNDDVKNL